MRNKVTEHKKFLWNMIGGISNASSSMLLLIIVNRTIGAEQGGIFSLAFAIAQMLITIATLEIRNYQATDLQEKFKLFMNCDLFEKNLGVGVGNASLS